MSSTLIPTDGSDHGGSSVSAPAIVSSPRPGEAPAQVSAFRVSFSREGSCGVRAGRASSADNCPRVSGYVCLVPGETSAPGHPLLGPGPSGLHTRQGSEDVALDPQPPTAGESASTCAHTRGPSPPGLLHKPSPGSDARPSVCVLPSLPHPRADRASTCCAVCLAPGCSSSLPRGHGSFLEQLGAWEAGPAACPPSPAQQSSSTLHPEWPASSPGTRPLTSRQASTRARHHSQTNAPGRALAPAPHCP